MTETLFKRIDTVFLPVRNLEKSIAWYIETLGVSLLWHVPGVGSLKIGETPLTLLQGSYPGREEALDPDSEFQPIVEVPFNLYANDIEHAHRVLLEKGVDVGAILDQGDVKEFQFRDPDGNCLGVCWWQE